MLNTKKTLTKVLQWIAGLSVETTALSSVSIAASGAADASGSIAKTGKYCKDREDASRNRSDYKGRSRERRCYVHGVLFERFERGRIASEFSNCIENYYLLRKRVVQEGVTISGRGWAVC